MKLSIDIGNGYVKAVGESGETLHFPTVLKEKREKTLFTSNSNYQIRINGKEYFIGDIAISKKGVRSWRNDKSMNADTEKYVALCCHVLSSPDAQFQPEQVDLSLGIPYSYYIDQGDAPEIVSNLKNKTFETVFDGNTKNFIIESVTLYPQGVGAYFYNILDIDGTPKKGAKDLIRALVIDIGYRTVDVVAFDNINGGFELIQEDSFSLEESGIINIVNHIVRLLSVEVQLDANEVERWLLAGNGIVQYEGGDLNIKQFENEAYQELADKISTSVNTKLSSEIKKYKNIFITGGGAKTLYPLLKATYKNAQLQEEYIYGNAKGYLAIENSD